MGQQRQAVPGRGGNFNGRRQAPADDPFAGDFSQERISQGGASWPVLQWHGGLAGLVGETDSMKVNGGFFIDDDRIVELGLDPNHPAAGFERVGLRLGGKQIPGWGASTLHVAFLFTDFYWEDRENGRLRFPSIEYERRKQQKPGSERALRGRTRALVGVRELVDEGVLEPLVLTMRGTFSAALNGILRDLKRMADEATRLRRRAGREGAIPREAFWVPIFAGKMEDVGEGVNTSRVALPRADLPADMSREFLLSHLVEEEHRRPGGTFDEWAQQHAAAWEERVAFASGDDSSDPYGASDSGDYGYVAEGVEEYE
jgi:hypothetical protein